HLADLRPAAVDDDRVHADQLHQHDIACEAALQGLVDHRIAAVLDDDGLAGEAADVWQRLGEDAGDVHRAVLVQCHRCGPDFLVRWSGRSGCPARPAIASNGTISTVRTATTVPVRPRAAPAGT